eukprot:CAMPEP_0178411376 /NCGR_PEP_ID=MMETSP0689_2-20121128/21463_1 /TAXON_ID=160604 /ORGANISM="Amphidinium massartii, Strain CS-259" /LENGTH=512 /DNA_ID=CAMNT_0020032581 /DNA_START=54 /DNA_END=1592 /DNA_ORIENTATION=+
MHSLRALRMARRSAPWLLVFALLASVSPASSLRPESGAEDTSLVEERFQVNDTSGAVAGTKTPGAAFLFMATSEPANEEYGLDKVISDDGELMVKKRIAQMKMQASAAHTLFQQVTTVLVAPHAAAITTALLAVALVWGDSDMSAFQVPLPKFRVVKWMREQGKVVPAGMSEANARSGIQGFARKVCKELLGSSRETFLDAAVEDLLVGYMKFLTDGHKQVPAPGNALAMHHRVHEVKYELYMTNAPALVVGDSELGTYMFMAGLPPKRPIQDADTWAQQNFVHLFRSVQSLTYASLIQAEWAVSSFAPGGRLLKNSVDESYTVPYLSSVDPLAAQLEVRKLPNILAKATNVPYDGMEYVHTELSLVRPDGADRHLPKDAIWHTELMKKKKWRRIRKVYSDNQIRLINVVAEPDPWGSDDAYRGYLTWTKGWGEEARGLVDLKDVYLEKIAGDAGQLKLSNLKTGEHWIITPPSTDTERSNTFYKAAVGLTRIVRGDFLISSDEDSDEEDTD